jgi:ABC-type transporter Mla subunit MlaD
MARKKRDALRAGIFMVLSFFAIIVVIMAIKGFSRVFTPTQTVTARFALNDDLGGLNRGDNVRIGGYTVGSVQAIHIQSGHAHTQIEVTFTIPKRYKLRKGVYLAVGGTVTGTSWLNFSSLGTGSPLPPHTIIHGHPGGLASEFERATAMFPDIKSIVHQVRTTTIPRINADLASIGTATKSIGQVAATAQKTVAAIEPRVPEIIHHYNRVTTSVTYAMNQAGKLLHSGRRHALPDINAITADIKQSLPHMLKTIKTDLVALHTTLVNAGGAAGGANKLLTANRHRISQMVRSLDGAASNLKLFAVEIHHSPWRLLYHPSKTEQANTNLYDAVREFNDAARHLSDTSATLKTLIRAGVHTAAQRKAVASYLHLMNQSFKHFQMVERRFWALVKH